MAKYKRTEKIVPLERIFLNHENPRHEPYETQAQVIEYLCRHEDVPQLARDVVKHGLSPLERFALYLDANSQDNGEATYVVAEGNRRVCALKLLCDPDLAPPDKRAFFERLANGWDAIYELPSVIFEDEADLHLWLERTHHGPQGGIGRKSWNADQKQRHSGGSKNKVALAVLDYAESKGFISVPDRKGKLTTVQRYLGNPLVREAMGLDISDPEEVCRDRPTEDFDLLIRKFISDLTGENPKVNSRSRKPEISTYAQELTAMEGQSRARIDPEPLASDIANKGKKERRRRPGKQRKPARLPYESGIMSKLKAMNSWKLQNLYNSICSISLQDHTPLLAVGVWSFFETLTAKAGRNDSTDFGSFLSANRLQQYGLGDKRKTRTLRDAVARISGFGNTTKHHETAAAFNSDQLANDMETLKELILQCADDAIAQSK